MTYLTDCEQLGIDSSTYCEACREYIALRASFVALQAERDALRSLLDLSSSEWKDKHIYPCAGEAYQNWAITVYLPEPLDAKDKSPEAALSRAIKAREVKP